MALYATIHSICEKLHTTRSQNSCIAVLLFIVLFEKVPYFTTVFKTLEHNLNKLRYRGKKTTTTINTLRFEKAAGMHGCSSYTRASKLCMQLFCDQTTHTLMSNRKHSARSGCTMRIFFKGIESTISTNLNKRNP